MTSRTSFPLARVRAGCFGMCPRRTVARGGAEPTQSTNQRAWPRAHAQAFSPPTAATAWEWVEPACPSQSLPRAAGHGEDHGRLSWALHASHSHIPQASRARSKGTGLFSCAPRLGKRQSCAAPARQATGKAARVHRHVATATSHVKCGLQQFCSPPPTPTQVLLADVEQMWLQCGGRWPRKRPTRPTLGDDPPTQVEAAITASLLTRGSAHQDTPRTRRCTCRSQPAAGQAQSSLGFRASPTRRTKCPLPHAQG